MSTSKALHEAFDIVTNHISGYELDLYEQNGIRDLLAELIKLGEKYQWDGVFSCKDKDESFVRESFEMVEIEKYRNRIWAEQKRRDDNG